MKYEVPEKLDQVPVACSISKMQTLSMLWSPAAASQVSVKYQYVGISDVVKSHCTVDTQ